MPEAKKSIKSQPRNYHSPIESQIGGVRLTESRQPEEQSKESQAGEVQAPPQVVVSKLIDFIKKI